MLINKLLDEVRGHTGIAVVFEDNKITYTQLLEKVVDLSTTILHYAPHEQFIGISATRSIEMVVGILAILKAGKTYLPLDPNYPQLRLKQIIEDSGLKYTVCKEEERHFYTGLNLDVINSDQQYNLPEAPVLAYSDIVCVLYTSGSTGKPKGVCLGNQGLMNQLDWQKGHGIARPGVRTLQFSHLSFDGAFLEIFVPLFTGGTLYLINESTRTNIGKLLHFIADNEINRMFLAYVVVQYLAETAQQYNLYPPSLKEIITGGELLRITPQIANFFQVLDQCVLMNVYGPTEASVWVTELRLKGNAQSWPAIPSLGRPIANAGIFIVDSDLKLLPDGEAGELLIHGDCLALYYLNKPEETAQRFIQWLHPSLGAIRVYRTGDLAAYNSDGSIQFHGRADEQVKIKGGYRVELSEIEVVIGNIPGISQTKVIVREDTPGLRRIVAYVILSNNRITEATIKAKVDAQLPAYMAPDSYVILQEFPRTVSGKIDKFSLPVPEKVLAVNAADYKAPVSELEQYIKTLWEDILQVKNISINADFFDLGGSSLIAIEMVTRIEKEKNIQLPVVSVYDYGTVEKLAKLIHENKIIYDSSPVVAIKPSGNRPPVYLVPGDNLTALIFNGIGRNIHPDQPVYGLQPKGIDGRSEPLTTIEDIARYYIDAMVQQHPSGPYAIAGYSFGGYVAIEMGKQLKQMGRQVLMLGMIDVDAHIAENFLSWGEKASRKITRQGPKLLWIMKSFVANPKKVMEYQRAVLSNRAKEMFNVSTEESVEKGTFYQLQQHINSVHHKALSAYHMEQYDGIITLFKAAERPYFVDDFEYMGWQKYATKGVNVYDIPGDHASMFTEPNCKLFAKQLEIALLNAQI